MSRVQERAVPGRFLLGGWLVALAATSLVRSPVARAAPATDIRFSVTNRPYVSLTDGHALIGGTSERTEQSGLYGEKAVAGPFQIGFPFVLGPRVFTEFGVNTSGLLTLGDATTGSHQNTLTSPPVTPAIAPFWNRANLFSGTPECPVSRVGVFSTLSGRPPEQVLTVEWRTQLSGEDGTPWNGGCGARAEPMLQFQARLHEGSNVLEFWYGPMTSSPDRPTRASVGIAWGPGSFLSVTPMGSAASASATVCHDTVALHAEAIPAGTLYTFAPRVRVSAAGTLTAWSKQPFSGRIIASGEGAPFTFSLVAGTFPEGLSMDGETGKIRGTPASPGVFDVVVGARSSGGTSGAGSIRIAVCQEAELSPPTLEPAGVERPVETRITVPGPRSWVFSLASGKLPGGMTLTKDGILVGAPKSSGDFDFAVTARDENGCTGLKSYHLFVCPLLIPEPPVLPVGTLLVPYKEKISFPGGAPPAKFSCYPGALPAGLTLDDGGVLSGTPTAAGSFPVMVVVTDAKRCIGERNYRLVVQRAPTRVTVTVSPDRVASGEPVTLTARVWGRGSPEGTVTFRDGQIQLGTANVECGEVVLRLKSLQAAVHPLRMDYSGDTRNLPSSETVELTVVRAKSAVTLTSSPNPARPGTPVTFRVTVTSGRFPSGPVTFRSGSGVLGTVYLPAPFWAPGLSQEDLQIHGGKPLNASSTEFTTTSLAEGTHLVTAKWGGDSEGEPSVSAPLEQRMDIGAPLPPPTPTPGPKTPPLF